MRLLSAGHTAGLLSSIYQPGLPKNRQRAIQKTACLVAAYPLSLLLGASGEKNLAFVRHAGDDAATGGKMRASVRKDTMQLCKIQLSSGAVRPAILNEGFVRLLTAASLADV